MRLRSLAEIQVADAPRTALQPILGSNITAGRLHFVLPSLTQNMCVLLRKYNSPAATIGEETNI